MKKIDAYQIITDRIIELLEKGTVPWCKPWSGSDEMPRNLVSRKEYRGVNVFLLSAVGYASPYWLTFLQVQKLGGRVAKGAKASPVVFWKWIEDGINDKWPMLRYYSVFNAEQCEGIEKHMPVKIVAEHAFIPVTEAEKIVADMPNKPEITHCEARAYYQQRLDRINMPKQELFSRCEEYYSTLFHELVHSTGHKSRLARFDDSEEVAFGSQAYSKEELVAEMGSTFLCNISGIIERTIDNSAAYISGWLERLKNDRTLVVKAATQAQKAVDYIRNVKMEDDNADDKID